MALDANYTKCKIDDIYTKCKYILKSTFFALSVITVVNVIYFYVNGIQC